MLTLYKNKYRSESARAQWWDYRNCGAYFITICTKDREYYFGNVKNGKMILSPLGEIAHQLWLEIPNHHNRIELDEFVVMPNHIHGIIIIQNPDQTSVVGNDENHITIPVGTGHALSLRNADKWQTTDDALYQQDINEKKNEILGKNRYQNIGKNSISSIIGSYKSAVTKHANKLGLPNGWQTRFYDRIIRDADEFERITEYIINNPEKWELDRFYRLG